MELRHLMGQLFIPAVTGRDHGKLLERNRQRKTEVGNLLQNYFLWHYSHKFGRMKDLSSLQLQA
jgi:hypothetical protein